MLGGGHVPGGLQAWWARSCAWRPGEGEGVAEGLRVTVA